MENKNKKAIHITSVDYNLWMAVKNEAMKRGIKANAMWIKILQSGAKRLKIAIE